MKRRISPTPACRWQSRFRQPRPGSRKRTRQTRGAQIASGRAAASAGTGALRWCRGRRAGCRSRLTRWTGPVEIDQKHGRRGPPASSTLPSKAVAAEDFLRPGSGVLRDLLDRGEPRNQRRWALLREVRPDARFCARARGRPGRRPCHPDGRQEREGRRRIRPDPSVRRVAGDAGPHHRGDPAPAPGARRALHAAGVLPDARGGREGRGRDDGRRDAAGDTRIAGPVHDRVPSRTGITWVSTATRRRCC